MPQKWVKAVQDAEVEDGLPDRGIRGMAQERMEERERERDEDCPRFLNDQEQTTKRNRRDTWVDVSCRNIHENEWIEVVTGRTRIRLWHAITI